MGIGTVEISYRNSYHLCSYLNLDYIYIGNFLFVEKLSIEALDYFIKKIYNTDYSIDEKLIFIVKNSYQEIIKDNFRKNKYVEESKSCYGDMIPSNFVDSDTLVVILQYGKNKKNLSKEDFKDNYLQIQKFLKDICSRMNEELSLKLKIKVKILLKNYVGV